MSENTPNVQNSTQVQYLASQLALARKEINNLRQQLKSQIHVHRKEHEEIKRTLENWQCLECRKKQKPDNCSIVENRSDVGSLEFGYVGLISTDFPQKRGTPRQPGICSDMVAKLTLNNDVFTNPGHALEGLEEFSHMWILFHFHKNDSTHVRAKVSPPRLNGLRTGVFATRSPHRPCPIGLSLVKIDRILENTVYFSGVDMVDQTPVLDIKPYVPQYDNPNVSNLTYQFDLWNGRNTPNNSNEPPPDVVDAGPVNQQQPSTSSTGNGLELVAEELDNNVNDDVRTMDGEENGRRRSQVVGDAGGATRNMQPPHEESFYTRSHSRIGEREAPDGEEEESPRHSQSLNNIASTSNNTPSSGNIRVPSWIDQPPVSTLSVSFKDRALSQLNQLGSEGEEKKTIIRNVLREDPRSVYLRERWGSHCYVFRIAELYVSCKFNDANHSVTVYQIFQNSASECDD